MLDFFTRPARLATTLLLLTAVPIIAALMRLYQIPAGQLPDIAQHLKDTPFSHFAHALAGAAFGLLGPLQFTRVLQRKFGRLHKQLGYVFVVSGAFLSLSAIHLLLTHLGRSTPVLDIARGLAGIGLGLSLWRAMAAILGGNLIGHKAWMIRAYAFGMGSATIVFVYAPYLLITGSEPSALMGDMLFVFSWVMNLVIGERVIWRMQRKRLPAAGARHAETRTSGPATVSGG